MARGGGGGGGLSLLEFFSPCELAVQEIFLWFINLFFYVARSCSIFPPPWFSLAGISFALGPPPPSPLITFSNGPASRQDRAVYATVWYFLQYWQSRLNQKPACLRSRPHLVRLLVWPSYLIRNWARSFSSTSRLQQSDHAQKERGLATKQHPVQKPFPKNTQFC